MSDLKALSFRVRYRRVMKSLPGMLAWFNLTHRPTRTATALAGVTFAVVMIFLQLGFFGSVETTATMVYDPMTFDLVLVARDYVELNRCGQFPRDRMAQARTVEGVHAVVPLRVGSRLWRHAQNPLQRRNILMIGWHPGDRVWHDRIFSDHESARELTARLARPRTVLMDRRSRPELGPHPLGLITELNFHRVEVVGHFTLGTGFGADGLALMSEQSFQQIVGPAASPDRVNIALVQLQPNTDSVRTVRQLRAILPDDVRVYTRSELFQRERRHWVRNTSVGVIFSLGIVVSLLVGVVFVYQVVASDVAHRLREYATLKAMGYSNHGLAAIVVQQAIGLAWLSFAPALVLAWLLYRLTEWFAGVPMSLTMANVIIVWIAAVGMCALSGMLATNKLRKADPADLF